MLRLRFVSFTSFSSIRVQSPCHTTLLTELSPRRKIFWWMESPRSRNLSSTIARYSLKYAFEGICHNLIWNFHGHIETTLFLSFMPVIFAFC